MYFTSNSHLLGYENRLATTLTYYKSKQLQYVSLKQNVEFHQRRQQYQTQSSLDSLTGLVSPH